MGVKFATPRRVDIAAVLQAMDDLKDWAAGPLMTAHSEEWVMFEMKKRFASIGNMLLEMLASPEFEGVPVPGDTKDPPRA